MIEAWVLQQDCRSKWNIVERRGWVKITKVLNFKNKFHINLGADTIFPSEEDSTICM